MATKKNTISFQEVREMSVAELRAQLLTSRKAYYQMQDDVLSGKEGNYKALRESKKSIARIATAIRQKEALEAENSK